MNHYDKAGALDGAIDAAVREMMRVDPRPGLRQRVTRAIGPRRQPVGGFRAGLAWAAALTIVAAGSVLVLRSPEPAQPPAISRGVTAPPAAPAVPSTVPHAAAVVPPPGTPRAPAPRREPAPESIFGPRADRVAAASLPSPGASGGAPPVAESVVPATETPGGVPAIAPIVLTPIQVAPIAVEPLSVSPVRLRR